MTTSRGRSTATMCFVLAAVVAAHTAAGRSATTATDVAEALGHYAATLTGALCLGGLVLILITAAPDERGVLDPTAFRAHLVVERASVVWLAVSAAMVVVQSAADAGLPVTRLLRGGGLAAALGASETGRAWVVVAVCAAVLAVSCRLTVRWEWHVPLMIPAIVGVLAPAVTGNAGQGPDHDYATSAVIVFAVAVSVWAGLRIVAVVAEPNPPVRGRVQATALAAGAVTALYGLGLWWLRVGAANLTTAYGWLGLVAAAALAVDLIAIAIGLRRGRASAGVLGALAATAVLAGGSLMSVATAPLLLSQPPTIFDVLLGYELPGPPTAWRLATFWRFDPFLGVAAIVLAGGYALAVYRLRRRGDRWPVGRTVSWLAGCAALLVATGSGVRSYGSAMFSIHMVEHMTLNMFVPVLLVLGAPVTLALRVLPAAAPDAPPGPREWIVRAVHSRFTTLLSNPATAFVLFVGSLYAVYFTPLFDTLVRYHWGHELMAVHFLITGYLFYWGIIGVDPGPRRLPFLGRLALLFAIMPFHAFFGIATMTMQSTLGANFYRGLALPWVPDINADQHLGGAIAWGASEVPLVMVVIALVTQWARQDRRDSTRSDRHADAGYDDDLEAYNNMLRELSRHRTRT